MTDSLCLVEIRGSAGLVSRDLQDPWARAISIGDPGLRREWSGL